MITSNSREGMCQKVSCTKFGKPTWRGCGQHIEAALQDVALEERCPGWCTNICVDPAEKPKKEEEKEKVAESD